MGDESRPRVRVDPVVEEPAADGPREAPRATVPRREKVLAHAVTYLVPQTGELFNWPSKGRVELTPEQTAEAETMSSRKRPAWWRQQRRKEADAAGR